MKIQNFPEQFADNFATKISNRENQEKYTSEYTSELYLRYMQSVNKKVNWVLKDISPKHIQYKLDKKFSKKYKIKFCYTTYKNYRNITIALQDITADYNTEDGQIRWIQDNNFDVHLGNFFSIVHQEIRNKMTNWKSMDLSLKDTLLIREKLQNISDNYNTEDGQIRWVQDNNFDVHLGSFFSIIPREIRNKMTNWKIIDLPFQEAKQKYKV